MGTILLERAQQPCLERVSITREGDWRRKAPWSISRPNAASNKMGRRQSQRKSQQLPSQENNTEKRPNQRRKNKPKAPLTSVNSQQSASGNFKSKSHPLTLPAEVRMEPKLQQAAQRDGSRQQKHRGSRHTAAALCNRLSDSSPDLMERPLPNLEAGSMNVRAESDSDTDLSDSERLSVLPSDVVPPQLELRPEVIEPDDCYSRRFRTKGQGHGGFDFPDFLPPPFNSWSLSQLAVFYKTEGRGAPRPRPVGSLERYFEKLLQLEWQQIQTVQEESGVSAASDVISSSNRSPTAASSRLSAPKCIFQCQRAFPLTLLTLDSPSTLLTGCACTQCRIRYSTFGMLCCRSTCSQTRQPRLSSLLERRGPVHLPKRSYSESRVHSSERGSASRATRFSSPVRTSSHLKKMQAMGNIRTPVQCASAKPHSTARESNVSAGRDPLKSYMDYRTAGYRRRSGSEQRKCSTERQQDASEKRNSGSECRKAGVERRRASEFKEREIKPDAVTAIMDNLPGSKYSPVIRPNRPKQVEFIT